MQDKFKKVADEVKKINDYYKENFYDRNIEKTIEKMVESVIKFARDNKVPLKISATSIIENVKNTRAGEEEIEKSSEYYEDSDC